MSLYVVGSPSVAAMCSSAQAMSALYVCMRASCSGHLSLFFEVLLSDSTAFVEFGSSLNLWPSIAEQVEFSIPVKIIEVVLYTSSLVS